jgi:hypothetical protein
MSAGLRRAADSQNACPDQWFANLAATHFIILAGANRIPTCGKLYPVSRLKLGAGQSRREWNRNCTLHRQ